MESFLVRAQGGRWSSKSQLDGDSQRLLAPRSAHVATEILERIPTAELLLWIDPAALAEHVRGPSRHIAAHIGGLSTALTRQIPDPRGRTAHHLACLPVLPQKAFVTGDLAYRFRLFCLPSLSGVRRRTGRLSPCRGHGQDAQTGRHKNPQAVTHGSTPLSWQIVPTEFPPRPAEFAAEFAPGSPSAGSLRYLATVSPGRQNPQPSGRVSFIIAAHPKTGT